MRHLALVTLLLAACQQTPEPPPAPGTIAPSGETVLTVNGKAITQNMVDAVTVRIPAEQLTKMKETPGQMDRFYDQLALGSVLYEKAIAENLHTDPQIQAGLAMAQREFLAGVYVQRKGEAAITDEAVQKYYDDRAVQYARPQVQARHILVKEEALANELKAKLDGGADFAALATENSKDTGSAQRGGDLGWFEEGRMVEEFSKAAFAAEKGQIVGPVSTRFGFHIIQVMDKRDKTPLEEVKPRIVADLRNQTIEGLIEETKKSLVVEKGAAATGTPGGSSAAGGPPGGPPPGMPGGPPKALTPHGAPPAGAAGAAPAAPPAAPPAPAGH